MVRHLILAQGLFNFTINNFRYTVSEITSERYGTSVLKQVNMNCIEFETSGVNDDDSSGSEIIPEDMQNIYPINLSDVSGNQEVTVIEDYMVDNIMIVLSTGNEAEVRVGITLGGTEVLTPKKVTLAEPVYTVDREYLANLAQYRNSFKLYFTITGVGAKVDLNTIIKKY